MPADENMTFNDDGTDAHKGAGLGTGRKPSRFHRRRGRKRLRNLFRKR